MNHLIAISALVMSTWVSVYAQMLESEIDTTDIETYIVQPERVEFEYKLTDRDYHVISANEEGLLIVQQTSVRGTKGYVWTLHMMDTNLNEKWKRDIMVPYGHEYIGYDFNSKDFFLLFNTNQYRTQELFVIQVAKDGLDETSHEMDLTLPIELSHFETLDDGLIFGGQSNGRPVVLHYNLVTDRPRVLPGIYNDKSQIINIMTSDEFRMFSVLVSEQMINKDYTVTMRVFDVAGNLLYTSQLETEREKNLLDAVATNFKNGVQYISGTYGENRTNRSTGFYLSRVQNGQQLFIKYHPYSDMYNFFSYMKEKRKKRVRKRIERKKIRGKQSKLNYRLLVHDIIRRGDEYLVIGEAYYPKYRQSSDYGGTPMAYDPFSYAYSDTQSTSKLAGYQYTHAVVASFNEDGDLLWDDSFEISDVLLPYLEKNIEVSVQKDRVVLLYAYDNEIRSKVLKNDESLIQGNSYDPIDLTFKADKIRNIGTNEEGLKSWFGDTYYAFGVQRIKNSADRGVKLNRKVFYINKVTFDLPD